MTQLTQSESETESHMDWSCSTQYSLYSVNHCMHNALSHIQTKQSPCVYRQCTSYPLSAHRWSCVLWLENVTAYNKIKMWKFCSYFSTVRRSSALFAIRHLRTFNIIILIRPTELLHIYYFNSEACNSITSPIKMLCSQLWFLSVADVSQPIRPSVSVLVYHWIGPSLLHSICALCCDIMNVCGCQFLGF